MKILHGMTEIAGQGINSVLGLREEKHDATMAVRQKNPLINLVDIDLGLQRTGKLGVVLDTIKMSTFAFKALRQFDVFHCHFGYSLLPRGLDSYLYKAFGLKCFVEFHGTELRFIYHPERESQYQFYKGKVPDKRTIQRMRKKLNRLIKHSEGIIIHDYELIPHLPNIRKPVYIVPLRVDIKHIVPHYPPISENKVPVIVHAPSNRGKKGTEQILKLLKEVKGEYQLVLVENVSHEEAMRIYEQADLIIDQVAIGTYGVFSIEAMALGKPLVTYVSTEMQKQFPDELPIVCADFTDMKEKVEALIEDAALRNRLGHEGRSYVEKYHDNTVIASHLYEVYEGVVKDNDMFAIL